MSAKNFIVGEVITITPGSSATRVVIDYKRDGNYEADASGTPPGAQSYTIPATGSATLSATIQGGGGTATTFACAGAASSSPATAETPPPAALQASVSRSQSTVVSTNIGTRLTSIDSPVGVSRATPTRPSVGDPSGNPDGLTTNFSYQASSWPVDRNSADSRSATWRDLAMLASFDTSSMVLSAAGDDNAPPLSPEQREDLLTNRPFTVWGHGSYSRVENKRNQSGDDARYSGDVWGYNLGLDYRFQSNLYAGLSLGTSETDLSTTYNSGTYDETSWTLTPYAVYKPTEKIKLSAMAGYAMGDVDQTRSSGSVTSSTDTKMWFGAFNASYRYQPTGEIPLELVARVGLLATNKAVDAYTESDGTTVAKATSNTRQVKPGIEATYTFDLDEHTVQPFVKGDFVHDFKDPINNDANAFDVGGGVRIGNRATGFSGSIEGQTQVGRSDYEEYSVSGMVAYGFDYDLSPTLGIAQHGIVSPYAQAGFDADHSQSFSTGLTFNSDDGNTVFEMGLTHTHASVRDNAAQFKLTLAF